jgi:hypothetical protein
MSHPSNEGYLATSIRRMLILPAVKRLLELYTELDSNSKETNNAL